MSTTVDNRVVEMRFDNKQFESGVATSMSTLDKLKQKLNLSGASKGLENISSAAKNVSFAGMNSGIDVMHAKFSALQVMGVTALANITNSAVNAGKKMVNALTFEPIMSGFNEYETKMNSIQTIMSNTASKGTTMSDVTRVIDELNTYADKTIYNFAEMTRNIGTFTAAGVGLEESAAAIKGIANLAAASGSSSQQASTAMYQLSQALAAGTVKLMDWNSVVNAGMGGEKFQEALKATAREMGIAVDDIIAKNGSFRDSLQEGWMTADVLNTTLNKFTVDGAKNYAEAMVKAGKYTQEQADALIKEAQAMEDAATKVKTFTQLWDTLKEAAQSGWGKTWELIIGDFEKAKERLTELSDIFGGFINKASDNRNNLLESGLSSKWDVLIRKMNTLGIETDDFQTKIRELSGVNDETWSKMIEKCGSFEKALISMINSGKIDKSVLSDAIKSFIGDITGATKSTGEMADQMKKYGEIVDKVIRGDFGNGEERIRKLTEAGHDYATIQGLVNQKLLGGSKAMEVLSEETVKNADNLSKLTDEQLKSKGYTEEQIEALRFLSGAADQAGMSIKDLIADFEKPSGAELLWDSLFDIIYSITEPLAAVKEAWKNTFGEMQGAQLYGIVEAVNSFTGAINKVATDTQNLDKLRRSFEGLFAIIDIITTIVGGGFKLAFKGLSKILGAFDMNILDLTANLGDAIVAFRDFLFDNQLVNKGFELLAIGVKKAADAFKNLIDAIGSIPQVKKFIDGIKDAINDLQNVDITEVGKNIIEGLQNGLDDGVKEVWNKMVEIGQGIIDAIKDVLGIHSPSRVMMAIGGFIISGLILGLKLAFPDVWDAIIQFGKDFYNRCREVFNDISWDKIFAGGVAVAMIYFVKQISDAIGGIANAFDGIGDMFEGVASVLTGFDKVLKGFAWDMKAKAMKKMAVAIAILVGAVVVLTQFDTGKLWNSVGIIAALATVMGVLAYATDKMSESSVKIDKNGASIEGMKSGLLAIGASLLLLAVTVKIVGNIDTGNAIKGFVGLTLLMGEMILFMKACGKFVDGESAKNIHKVGSMMLKLSIALLLMVGVCKLVSGLSGEEMLQGAVFATAFGAFVIAITKVAKSSGNNVSKVGGLMIKLAIAMGLMIGVVKMVGLLSAEDMLQGVVFVGAFTLFVKVLVNITKIGKKQQIAKIGGMMLGISTSLMLMIGVCKLVGLLSVSDIVKVVAFISGFVVLVKVLVGVLTIGSEQQMGKVAATILAMSVAIGILAAIAVTLSLIDLAGLAKGVTAVTILGLMMTGMIKALKGAQNIKGSIIAMTVAIGLMTASVAALCLIDTKKMATSALALSTMMGMFALMSKSLKGIEGFKKDSILQITTMIAVIGAMAGIIYLLSGLEVGSTIEIAASLSLLLLSLSKSMVIASRAGTMAMKALIPLGVMTLVVGGLATIIGLLAKCEVGSTIEIAASLSLLLLSLSGACVILAGVGLLDQAAFIGIGALVTLIASVGGVMVALGALATYFPKMEEFLDKGLPLLEKIGYGLGSFFGNIVGGFSAGVSSGLPEIADNLSTFMDKLLDGAKNIKEDSLTGVKNLASMFALLAGANILEGVSKWLTGNSSMETFSTNLNSFADAITSFSDKVKGKINEESVMAAANAGKLLAEMQSLIQGTGGVFQFFTGEKDLVAFGNQLVAFGDSIVLFSQSVSGKINEEAVMAAANAGKLMAEMQAKIVPSGGVVQWFSGEKNMATFGSQLVAFGDSMSLFSKSVSGKINEEAVVAAANAGKVMSEMQSKVVSTGGVVDFFTGTKNLAFFGTQLVAFGDAIVSFSNKVKSGVNEEAITAAANAGKLMSEMQSKVVPSGGVVDFFTGTKNLAFFGTQIAAFGRAICDFSKSVTGDNAINEDAVMAAANTGKVMASLQKAIPDDKWFDGKVPIDDFGAKIKRFGMYIAGYGKEVADIDSDKISSSATQAKKLVGIAKIASEIDPEAIGKFKNISIIADGMKNYSNKVKDIDAGKVSSSVTSATKLKNLINSLAGIDNSGIYKFNVSPIGNSIKSYSSSVTGMNYGAVSMSIIAIKQLIGTINSMAGLNTSGVGLFASAINSLSKVSISGVIKAFSGASSKLSNVGRNLIDSIAKGMKSRQSSLTSNATNIINSAVDKMRGRTSIFESTGKILMTNFISGIRSQNGKVASATTASLNSAVNKMRSYHRSFYNAGSYLVSGFSSGISANSYKASAKAAAMASAAYKAAKNKLDINSPSKVFRKLGYSVPEGFAQGIDRFGRIVKRSSMGMADTAIDGTKRALSRVARAVDGDMDAQPTIRPVLDLSDIKSGAGAIHGLLGQGSTIGVSANVNAVSSMMNQRAQNSSMDEVVSAINKLRKDLSNIGNTSYTINGVTYDDGSNISDAVKALVRAARVERRI